MLHETGERIPQCGDQRKHMRERTQRSVENQAKTTHPALSAFSHEPLTPSHRRVVFPVTQFQKPGAPSRNGVSAFSTQASFSTFFLARERARKSRRTGERGRALRGIPSGPPPLFAPLQLHRVCSSAFSLFPKKDSTSPTAAKRACDSTPVYSVQYFPKRKRLLTNHAAVSLPRCLGRASRALRRAYSPGLRNSRALTLRRGLQHEHPHDLRWYRRLGARVHR